MLGKLGSISRSSGFLYLGWVVHYIPFFFMKRELYLHHYLPAFYFAVLLFTMFFDLAISGLSRSRKMLASALVIMLILWSFSKFSPLTFGSPMSDSQCKSLRWKKKWDIRCGAEEIKETFATPTRVAYADDVPPPPNVIMNELGEEDL
jgi:dolichyl-phosphate-mannose-protein mannosyltransferase